MTRGLALLTSLAGVLGLAAQQGCLLTSDFDGLSSGGGSATSASSGSGGDCCLGQVCGEDGQCQPIELVNDAIATSIALNGDHVFWTDTTHASVRGLAKDAPFGTAPTEYAPSVDKPANLFATQDALFFSSYDQGNDSYSVLRKDLQGDAAAVEIASGPGRVTSLGVDATHVYFATASLSSTSDILRCLRTGGPTETLVSASPYGFLGLTFDAEQADDGYVYWARTSTFPEGAIQGVHKEKLQAEQPTTLVGNQSGPRSLAVGGGTLYWINSGNEGTYGYRLLSASTTGSNLTVLEDAYPSPWALARRGSELAWTTLGADTMGGVVAVTDLTSGKTRVFGTEQPWPGSVAIDDKAVYWANEYNNRLTKVGTCACQPP